MKNKNSDLTQTYEEICIDLPSHWGIKYSTILQIIKYEMISLPFLRLSSIIISRSLIYLLLSFWKELWVWIYLVSFTCSCQIWLAKLVEDTFFQCIFVYLLKMGCLLVCELCLGLQFNSVYGCIYFFLPKTKLFLLL